MPPKKHKIEFAASGDFTIIGISCHLKDYRVAFFLNQQLHFSLQRVNDLVLCYEDCEGDKDEIVEFNYSFFIFRNREDRRDYYLVSNHHPERRLIGSHKAIDYFLFINDIPAPSYTKELILKIQEIPGINTAYHIDDTKIGNAGPLFSEIELHALASR